MMRYLEKNGNTIFCCLKKFDEKTISVVKGHW